MAVFLDITANTHARTHHYTRNITLTPLRMCPLTYALRDKNQQHIPDLTKILLKTNIYMRNIRGDFNIVAESCIT
jgi:hypothetical protein